MENSQKAIKFLGEARAVVQRLCSSFGQGWVWFPVLVEGRDDACAVLWEANDGLLNAIFFVWKNRDGKIQSERALFKTEVPRDFKIEGAKQEGDKIFVEISPPIGTFVHNLSEMNIVPLLS